MGTGRVNQEGYPRGQPNQISGKIITPSDTNLNIKMRGLPLNMSFEVMLLKVNIQFKMVSILEALNMMRAIYACLEHRTYSRVHPHHHKYSLAKTNPKEARMVCMPVKFLYLYCYCYYTLIIMCIILFRGLPGKTYWLGLQR